MKKLTMLILVLAISATAQDRAPASAPSQREVASFGPYAAYAALIEGMTSDERIIFLKTPVLNFRLPASTSVSFGPLRPPGSLFAPDPFSVP